MASSSVSEVANKSWVKPVPKIPSTKRFRYVLYSGIAQPREMVGSWHLSDDTHTDDESASHVSEGLSINYSRVGK